MLSGVWSKPFRAFREGNLGSYDPLLRSWGGARLLVAFTEGAFREATACRSSDVSSSASPATSWPQDGWPPPTRSLSEPVAGATVETAPGHSSYRLVHRDASPVGHKTAWWKSFRSIVGCGPPRRRRRWTPERHNYQRRATSGSWAGPDMAWVGSDLARRWGWHVAEQAALEVDRVVRLGRPVQNRRSLATHFARCFARPQLCHRRHQGACGNMRLNQHRARRLDEDLETRTQGGGSSPEPSPTPAPNSATRPGWPVPVTVLEPRAIDQAQFEAALARLPAPLAAQLARLATRHRIGQALDKAPLLRPGHAG